MLDRTLFALSDECRTRENNRKQCDVVDNLHDRGEPVRIQIRVKLGANDDIDRRLHTGFPASEEVGYLLSDYGLDVDRAVACLCQRGGVDVKLEGSLATGQQIHLETGRDFQDEDQAL